MRNCLICVLIFAAAALWPPARAAAQSETEEARVGRLLADGATAWEKVRAYDRLHQKLADLHGQRGQALEKEGKKEEGGRELARANAELLLARQAYEIALQRYPGHAALHNYYGELLFDRFDEQDKGVGEWRKALELDEKLGRAHNNLGIFLCHAGEYAKGLASLDKAVLLEPDNPDYQFNLAQIYLTNWQQVMQIRNWPVDEVYKAAMTASESAARFDPNDFELAADYARNFFVAEEMGVVPDWGRAAEAWQRARQLVRNDDEKFNAWLNEARVWYKAGRGGKAVKCCEESLKIRPQSMVAKELMAMAREPNRPRSGK